MPTSTPSSRRRSLAVKAERQPTLAEQVTERLREEIISGQLVPGSMMAEIPTAERLGVSRVPVREATLVLERDGLLVFEGRGRCRVRALAPRDFQEIYDVRLLIEQESFRLAAKRHRDEDLAAMEANIQKMSRARSMGQTTLLDIEFHDLIVATSGHTRLQHLWRTMRGQIQLFTAALQREVFFVMTTVREAAVMAHRDCLKVIATRDEEAASRSAADHLVAWREWLETHGTGKEVQQ
ncbi:MAG: GntR family transcriptional regulator [Planctomycetaceae bacterium]